jgi:4-amino-4-deoxy-L-arabinose transferase-like glycosyltransferase
MFWGLLILLVNPVGEFPLNDDWSYASTVRTLLDEARFHLSGWTSMPLVAQVLWGALFCLPLGFSFTALRISTLVLALIGGLATYGLMIEINAGRKLAILSSFVLLTSPLYFQHAFTFMTDVPFVAVSILSCYYLVRSLKHEKRTDLALGTIFAVSASLIRQLGILIPLSYSAAIFARYGLKRKAIIRILSHCAFALGPFFIYQFWIASTQGLPDRYNAASERIVRSMADGLPSYIEAVSQYFLGGLIYLGIFLLPFLVLSWRRKEAEEKKSETYAGLLTFLGFVAVYLVVWKNQWMPLLGNVLFDFGLGPPHLRDINILGLPHWPSAPISFWLSITVLGLGAAAFIGSAVYRSLVRIFRNRHRFAPDDGIITFITALFLSNFILIVFIGYYDRYLIFFIPGLMMLVFYARPHTFKMSRWSASLSLLVLFLFVLFSVTATHDYLSWNRARWSALDSLIDEYDVQPGRIDGGFEFNGWYLYDPAYVRTGGKSYWWVDKDDYIISFGPIQGYAVVKTFPFQRWFPREKAFIYILRKIT